MVFSHKFLKSEKQKNQFFLKQLFLSRRDVRRFKRKSVPKKVLKEIFQIADLAPSVGLSQPWRVYSIESQALRKKVQAFFLDSNHKASKIYGSKTKKHYRSLKLEGLQQAPIQLAVFCDQFSEKGKGLGRQSMPETLHYSCVCMIQSLWIIAKAYGLGMGWLSILDSSKINALFKVPKSYRFIGYLMLGYPRTESEIPFLERDLWEKRSPYDLRWLKVTTNNH